MTNDVPTITARKAPWIETLALAIFAIAARLPAIDRLPKFDEFYHMLAARSWLESGTFTIDGGTYDRARLFTALVAASMRLFGDGIVEARLPALIAGVLWVIAVFWWLRRRNGPIAAWTAGALMALAPSLMFLSQICRFYTLHALCIWLAATWLYGVVERTSPRRWIVPALIATVLALILALHLQDTTLIATLALGAWIAAVIGQRLLVAWRHRPGLLALLIVGCGAVVVAGLLVLHQTGTLEQLQAQYRWAPEWAAASRDSVRYYFNILASQYPALWALLPLALVLACNVDGRRTIFCATIFGVAFVVHSFAGAKEPRYFAYVMPFFFAIWGLALSVALPWLFQHTVEVVGRFVGWAPLRGAIRPAAIIVIVACLVFAIFDSGAFSRSVRILRAAPTDHYTMNESDWPAATDRLRDLADEADVVIVTAGPKALYFLGDYDYELNASGYLTALQAARAEGREPQDEDPGTVLDDRVDHLVIKDLDVLRGIMDDSPRGLIIAESLYWRYAWGVDPTVTEYIEAIAEEVEVAPEAKLRVFRWN